MRKIAFMLMTTLLIAVNASTSTAAPAATAAPSFANVDQNRLILDPVVLRMNGVIGSMIGICIKGSNRDPFDIPESQRPKTHPCLVYLVRDERVAPRVRKKLVELGMYPQVQIRFQVVGDLIFSR